MKKLYLIIFSLLLSTNSYAEYYFLMKNLDSQFYMDMSSIKKLNNGHIRVWEYINFLKQKGITCHVVNMRHSMFWEGGIHCLTLDVSRRGEKRQVVPVTL